MLKWTLKCILSFFSLVSFLNYFKYDGFYQVGNVEDVLVKFIHLKKPISQPLTLVILYSCVFKSASKRSTCILVTLN